MTDLNLTSTIEIPENTFYSKEEITELTGVSIHTLNNWLKEYKPEENELELGRQNRRAYSKQYLLRLFGEVKRDDLINLVNASPSLGKSEFEDNKNLGKAEVKPSNYDLLIQAKDETIQELKGRVQSLEDELKEKNIQIRATQELLKNQQTLTLQQNSLFLETKNSKNRSFFGWFNRKASQEVDNG